MSRRKDRVMKKIQELQSTGTFSEFMGPQIVENIGTGVDNGLDRNSRVDGARYIQADEIPFAIGGESAVFRAKIHLRDMTDKDIKRTIDDIATMERTGNPEYLIGPDGKLLTLAKIRRAAQANEVIEYVRQLDSSDPDMTKKQAREKLQYRSVLERILHDKIKKRFRANTVNPNKSTIYECVLKISIERMRKDKANIGARGVKLFRGVMRDDFAGCIFGEVLNGRVIMAEEFVDKVDPYTLPLEQRIRLVKQLLGAVAYMHERDIIHRDIKEDNMLVVKVGPHRYQARLTDLGMIKAVNPYIYQNENITKSLSTVIRGTPTHIAPEQTVYVEGQSKDSKQSDVYQCGGLLYEMITGKKPIPVERNASIVDTLNAIQQSDTKRDKRAIVRQSPLYDDRLQGLSRKKRKLLELVEKPLECALQYRPEARYSDIREFEEDLGLALQGKEPIHWKKYKSRMYSALSKDDRVPSQDMTKVIGSTDERNGKAPSEISFLRRVGGKVLLAGTLFTGASLGFSYVPQQVVRDNVPFLQEYHQMTVSARREVDNYVKKVISDNLNF